MEADAEARNATHQVLNTTELLEHILLRVSYDVPSQNFSKYDMKTVLLSQRVNRKFQAVVRGSHQIRVKLWLEPGARDRKPLGLNPLLEEQFERRRIPHIALLCLSSSPMPAPLAIIGTSQMAVESPPAIESWRDMLVVQPHPQQCSTDSLKWELWGHEAPDWKSKTRWKCVALRDCPTAGQLVDRQLRKKSIPHTHYEIDLINQRYYREGKEITNEVKRREQC